jgi:Protein of unknown function (DUF229)
VLTKGMSTRRSLVAAAVESSGESRISVPLQNYTNDETRKYTIDERNRFCRILHCIASAVHRVYILRVKPALYWTLVRSRQSICLQSPTAFLRSLCIVLVTILLAVSVMVLMLLIHNGGLGSVYTKPMRGAITMTNTGTTPTLDCSSSKEGLRAHSACNSLPRTRPAQLQDVHQASCQVVPYRTSGIVLWALRMAVGSASLQCPRQSAPKHARIDHDTGMLHIKCGSDRHQRRALYNLDFDPVIREWTQPVDVRNHEVIVTYCYNVALPEQDWAFNAVQFLRGWAGHTSRQSMTDYDVDVIVQISAQYRLDRLHRRHESPPKTSRPPSSAPHLEIIFLDSLSRPHFWRTLTETAQTLRALDVTNGNGAGVAVFDFQMLNVVGLNTQENLEPMMTGLPFRKNTHDTTGPSSDRTPSPWLAGIFRAMGYRTMLSPGACMYFNVYSHELNPHEYGPFDHILWTGCDREFVVTQGAYQPGKARCFGSSHLHELSLQYQQTFRSVYAGDRRFSFLAFEEAHEPSGAVIGTVDQALSQHIQSSIDSLKSDTVMVLLADHGLNYGPTFPFGGAHEQKMPLFAMLVPQHLLDANPHVYRNLYINQNRLMSPYDVFETLQSIPSVFSPEIEVQATGGLGRNLLTSELSPIATCEELSIPPIYCMCTGYA